MQTLRFLVVSCLLASAFLCQAQTQGTLDTVNIKLFQKEGDEFRKNAKYEAAITSYRKAMENTDTSAIGVRARIAMQMRISNIFDLQYKVDSALYFNSLAEQIARNELRDTSSELYIKIIDGHSQSFLTAGKPDSALYYAQIAMKKAKVLGDTSLLVANLSHSTGNILRDLGRYKEAIASYKTNLAIREKLNSPDRILRVYQSTYSIGTVYRVQGDTKNARIWQNKALPLAEQTGEKTRPPFCIRELAWCDYYECKFEESLKKWRTVVALRNEIYGADNPRMADDLNALGSCLIELGQIEEGHTILERSVRLAEKKYKPEHPDLGLAYTNYANVLIKMHLYDEALLYAHKAQDIFELSTNPLHKIDIRTIIATVYFNKREYEAAERTALENITLIEATQQQKLPSSLKCAALLARVYTMRNKPENAFDLSQRYLTLLGDKPTEVIPVFQLNYAAAIALTQTNKLDQAEQYYQKALVLAGYSDTGGPHGQIVSQDFQGIVPEWACFLQKKDTLQGTNHANDIREIIAYYLRLTEQEITDATAPLSRINLVSQNYDGYQRCAEVLSGLQEQEAAFELLENTKSRNLIGEVQRATLALPPGYPAATTTQENDLVLQIALDRAQIAQYPAQKDSLTNILNIDQTALQALRESIRIAYPAYHRQKYAMPQCAVSQLRDSVLDPETALISYYVRFNKFSIALVTRDTICFWRKEYPQTLAALAAQYHALVGSPGRFNSGTLDSLKQLSFDLYTMLLAEPVALAGSGIKHFIISTDGALGVLPFGAILSSVPTNNRYKNWPYLINQYRFQYISSAAMLFQHYQRTAASSHDFSSFAGFAPTYLAMADMPLERKRSVTGLDGLPDLPYAREEVRELAVINQGKAWLGLDANESNFRQNYQHKKVLHLAMHGMANTIQPELSKLFFADLGSTAPSGDDGVLTAAEISTLPIDAGMVVLSACYSALGKSSIGEGVQSLAYSFVAAGAPAVVSSIWQADDEQTKAFMLDFYQNLRLGQPKDEALRQAQRTMIGRGSATPELSHPFYWAPFVLLGSSSPLR